VNPHQGDIATFPQTSKESGEERTLGPGEEAVAQPGQLHAWSNETAEPAVVRVELRPGHAGFEKSLRVDGLVHSVVGKGYYVSGT
jgi:hypothetical protein